LFSGENFKFGNPVQDFHCKLRGENYTHFNIYLLSGLIDSNFPFSDLLIVDGYFYPDVVKYKKLCNKAKKKEYKVSELHCLLGG